MNLLAEDAKNAKKVCARRGKNTQRKKKKKKKKRKLIKGDKTVRDREIACACFSDTHVER